MIIRSFGPLGKEPGHSEVDGAPWRAQVVGVVLAEVLDALSGFGWGVGCKARGLGFRVLGFIWLLLIWVLSMGFRV